MTPLEVLDVDRLAVIERLLTRPAWHQRAACRGAGPAAWYPTNRARRVSPPVADACTRCPVSAECRNAGHTERHGVWGGELRG